MKKSIKLKKDGFPGERYALIPQRILREASTAPVTRDLMLTAIGHFPHAAGHFVTRPEGIANETILIFCTEGSGWYRLHNQPHRLNAGTAVVIPPGTPHAYGTTKRAPWTIYWVHCTGNRINDYLDALHISTQHPQIFIKNTGEIIHHFESLYGLIANAHNRENQVAISTALANLLGHTALHRTTNQPARDSGLLCVQRTIPFMREHVTSNITLSELAQTAALSVPHYCALFKEHTGESPKAFFLNLKMQEAARLLETTSLNIKEVAAHISIRDPYYFSRIFRKIMKMPPSLYRRQNQGKQQNA